MGKDVAEALGYSDTDQALRRHVDPEDKNTVVNPDGNRGNPNITIINESGLYSLVRAVMSLSDAAYGRASSPARFSCPLCLAALDILGCGALFLLRGTRPACKKQTAAPAPLRLFLPQAAPQLRSPARGGDKIGFVF